MAASVDEVWDDWRDIVNMTARELDKWLDTDKSQSVDQDAGSRTSAILRSPKASLTDDDVEHMTEVVEFVKRHKGLRPRGDIRETRWRYSLMNRGHDPMKS